MTMFKIVVVVIGMWPKPQLLNADVVLLFLGFFFFLLFLESVLSKIYNFAHRRIGIRGDFHKVELVGSGQL